MFLAAARGGSHKAAARRLGVNPTTVGRRLGSLESALGTKLFQRTPDSLALTGSGLSLLASAERVEAELLTSERELLASDQRTEGTLKVTAGDGFLHCVLLPSLSQLRLQHPRLVLELSAEASVLDLSRQDADVAIRFGRPRQASLVARRFAWIDFGLYASEPYLARSGTPRGLDALASHEFIGFATAFDEVEHVRWLRRAVKHPRYVLRANTTMAQAQMAVDGHGIALLPAYVAAREPRLHRLLPRLQSPRRELWFVTHQDVRNNSRVGAFRQFVTALLP